MWDLISVNINGIDMFLEGNGCKNLYIDDKKIQYDISRDKPSK